MVKAISWVASLLVFWDAFERKSLKTTPAPGEVSNMNCREGIYPDSDGIHRVKFLPDHLDFYSEAAQGRDLDYYKPPHLGRIRNYEKIAEWNILAGISGPYDEESFGDRQARITNEVQWDRYHNGINRKSYHQDKLLLDWIAAVHLNYRKVLVPFNVIGRTGVTGIGKLDEYGPNHCVDIVITRRMIKPGTDNEFIMINDKYVMEALVIKRGDNGEIALPGGKVNPYENPMHTAYRELWEEAGPYIVDGDITYRYLGFHEQIKFDNIYYTGYSDDEQNTDRAWKETQAVGSHGDTIESPHYKIALRSKDQTFEDEDGSNSEACNMLRKKYNGKPLEDDYVEPTDVEKEVEVRYFTGAVDSKQIPKRAEALNVFWLPVNRHISLAASHRSIIKRAALKHGCHY